MRSDNRGHTRRSYVVLAIYAGLVFVFLYVPILTIIVFSFGESVFPTIPIPGFTLEWYETALGDVQLIEALKNSLLIAPLVGVVSATVGLLAARELARRRFRGQQALLLVIVGPLLVPLIVFGLSLLLLYNAIGLPQSILGAVIAHSVFGISISTLILYSRLLGFQESLMEAAVDLGARPSRAFIEILVPLVLPAYFAAFLLSFTLSFDEFIVAWFVIGFDTTLPVEIWGRLRYGISPDINAIASIVLVISLALGVLAQRLVTKRKEV